MLNPGRTRQEIERIIHEEIRHILEERDESITDISNADTWHADLGLESLDLAQLVAVLETKLQADPFEELVAITDMRTVGDLCRAYQTMLTAPGREAAAGAELIESQRRARARRDRRGA